MSKIKLLHGSKTRINGPIRPCSRDNCDFGTGFYMGNNAMQPNTLIARSKNPHIYELSLDLDSIPRNRILKLEGKSWMLSVMYHRHQLESIKNTPMYNKIANINANKDLIIGPIADDQMMQLMEEFIKNHITDNALMACMQYMDYGTQYVAKTPEACSKIEILSEKSLTAEDKEYYLNVKRNIRSHIDKNIDKVREQYHHDGLLFSQMLENYKRQAEKTTIITDPQQLRDALYARHMEEQHKKYADRPSFKPKEQSLEDRLEPAMHEAITKNKTDQEDQP